MQEKWGKLEESGFSRLLHDIFATKDKASALDIESGKIKKRFFFKTGIPVYALSNILSEVLGRLLVRKGIISQETYEKSLEIMLNEKKKQGEVLLSNNSITPHQLNDALNTQVKERLFSVFSLTGGTYHYYKIENFPKDLFLYPVHPAYVILHAVKMGYCPFDKVKEEIEKDVSRLVAFSARTAYELEDFQPSMQERKILTLIDGRKTLNNIITELEARAVKKEEFYPFIYALIIMDILTLKVGEKEKLKEKPEEISKEDNALMENLTSRYLQLKSLNYFEVLGVAQDTDNNTIKNAYFKLAKEYHPDRYHNTPAMRSIASDIFSIINTSYNTLSDEKSRIAYLDSLKTGNKQDVVQEAANIMNAELQFQKGKVALSKRNYNVAKEAFDWAIKLNPDEGEYKTYLGWSIFNISPKDAAEVEKAKGIIEEAVSSNPNQDRAYYFLGVIYKMEGRIGDAETAFSKAVQKNPNIPEALSELRLIQMRKQKDSKGLFKKRSE